MCARSLEHFHKLSDRKSVGHLAVDGLNFGKPSYSSNGSSSMQACQVQAVYPGMQRVADSVVAVVY